MRQVHFTDEEIEAQKKLFIQDHMILCDIKDLNTGNRAVVVPNQYTNLSVHGHLTNGLNSHLEPGTFG
jgi:hypothetical protein